MIVHVVLLKPKPEVTDEQRQAIVAQLRQAAATIPSVRRLQVGKRVRHGRPGYEQLMGQDFDTPYSSSSTTSRDCSPISRIRSTPRSACTSCSQPRRRSRMTTK